MTKKYKMYLAGPCKNVKDEGKGWRQRVVDWITSDWTTVDVYDPTVAYDYSFRIPATTKECRLLYEHHIKDSDLILVGLDHTNVSPGTLYELAIAHEHNIPIVGVGTTDIYAWAEDVCDIVFDSWKDAINYIMVQYFYYAK